LSACTKLAGDGSAFGFRHVRFGSLTDSLPGSPIKELEAIGAKADEDWCDALMQDAQGKFRRASFRSSGRLRSRGYANDTLYFSPAMVIKVLGWECSSPANVASGLTANFEGGGSACGQ
jgi:hypothetical protein